LLIQAKFKQEFIKQMQAREDIGVLHKEHEYARISQFDANH